MTRRTKTKPNESKTTSPKPTAHERTRVRQTGVGIKQLRAEQEAAERMMKLNSERASVRRAEAHEWNNLSTRSVMVRWLHG